MERFTDVLPVRLVDSRAAADPLRLAVAAFLARYMGSSRDHAHSDLRCFLAWCAERGLDPLAASRVHLELYIRWMQEVRRFKPSTVSRRFSVASGFYRTAVIDGVLEHSPAEHVRRPAVPPESPTLGFTHLQFEAMLTAARESPNPYDFALVAMLGPARAADLRGIRREHRRPRRGARGTAYCGSAARAARWCWCPCRPLSHGPPSAVDGRSAGPILLNSRGARMDRHAATRRLRNLAAAAGVRIGRTHPHMLRHTFVTTMLDAGADLAGCADRRPAR
jgi:integrase/recombinase XerD